jgi:1,4-dihydroxy-2-naphthoate octaprenyltransferase
MANVKIWINAMRLRTLPLSLATILTGNFIAVAIDKNITSVFILTVITTVFLQILSNLANDLGDHLKGTDNDQRLGPLRATQSGKITVAEMKAGILIFIILSLASGISLLVVSKLNTQLFFIFLGLGIASILAAIFYTMGKKPYGYRAMGDLFVFIFFGLIGVGGSFYLNTGELFYELIFPAISVGFFSTGVLNMNNMRDHENDKKQNKITLVVLLGIEKAKIYHTVLITGGMLSTAFFVLHNYTEPKNLLFLLSYPLFTTHLIRVWKNKNEKEYDPELKKLAIAAFLFSVLLGISIIDF